MSKDNVKVKLGSNLVGLVSSGALYTCWGLLTGLVYLLVAPALSLPSLGIGALLGLWWLWFLIMSPMIVFAVSLLRATEPLGNAANKE